MNSSILRRSLSILRRSLSIMNSSILRRSLSSDASYSLNKFLKLRGAIFTLEVLVGNCTVATTQSSVLAAASVPTFKSVSHATYDTSQEIHGISTVQSKYFSKISRRLGGSNPIAGLDTNNSLTTKSKGDGKLLQDAKATMQRQEQLGQNPVASRWMLVEGMGTLLDYTSLRTIQMAIFKLPSQTSSLLQNFLHQVSDTPWLHVGSDSDPDTSSSLKQFEAMEEQYLKKANIVPGQLILISSSESFLEMGKQRGYMTCRYRPPNGFYGQVTTDYSATNSIEIQDCLEELNGVAFRNSAFSSRSF